MREQRTGDAAKAAVTKAAILDGTGGELTLPSETQPTPPYLPAKSTRTNVLNVSIDPASPSRESEPPPPPPLQLHQLVVEDCPVW